MRTKKRRLSARAHSRPSRRRRRLNSLGVLRARHSAPFSDSKEHRGGHSSDAEAVDATNDTIDVLQAAVTFEPLTDVHREEASAMLRLYGRHANALTQLMIKHKRVSTLVLLEEFPIAVISCLPYASCRDLLPRTGFPLEDTAWLISGTLCMNFPVALLPWMWRIAIQDQATACSAGNAQEGGPLFERIARRYVHIGFAEKRPGQEDYPDQRRRRKSGDPSTYRGTSPSSSQPRQRAHCNGRLGNQWFFPSLADHLLYQNATETEFLSPETVFTTNGELAPVAMLIDADRLLEVCNRLELETPGQVQQRSASR